MHKISALRWMELWDDHRSPLSHSSGCPPFSPPKTTGRQDDLSDSHFHCWSVRLSLLVFTSCHTDLPSEASEALASAWSLRVNCAALSLWMRLPCHFCFTLYSTDPLIMFFSQFIKSECFCSAFFFSSESKRALSLAKMSKAINILWLDSFLFTEFCFNLNQQRCSELGFKPNTVKSPGAR